MRGTSSPWRSPTWAPPSARAGGVPVRPDLLERDVTSAVVPRRRASRVIIARQDGSRLPVVDAGWRCSPPACGQAPTSRRRFRRHRRCARHPRHRGGRGRGPGPVRVGGRADGARLRHGAVGDRDRGRTVAGSRAPRSPCATRARPGRVCERLQYAARGRATNHRAGLWTSCRGITTCAAGASRLPLRRTGPPRAGHRSRSRLARRCGARRRSRRRHGAARQHGRRRLG
jgi:hypothetical protein